MYREIGDQETESESDSEKEGERVERCVSLTGPALLRLPCFDNTALICGERKGAAIMQEIGLNTIYPLLTCCATTLSVVLGSSEGLKQILRPVVGAAVYQDNEILIVFTFAATTFFSPSSPRPSESPLLFPSLSLYPWCLDHVSGNGTRYKFITDLLNNIQGVGTPG